MKNKERNTKKQEGLLLIVMGLLLMTAALFLAVYNLWDEARAKQSVEQVVEQLEEYLPVETTPDVPDASAAEPPAADSHAAEPPASQTNEIEIPDYVLNPYMDMPVRAIDGQDFIGILEIPALELLVPVISQWSYPSLKIAPCRYSGSAYLNNLIIAGHNYNSHFGTLKQLQEGDAVIFTDMDGNVFTYTVAYLETLPPTAMEEMERGDWDLTLFTCTVGGQNRVTVRCVLEEDGI